VLVLEKSESFEAKDSYSIIDGRAIELLGDGYDTVHLYVNGLRAVENIDYIVKDNFIYHSRPFNSFDVLTIDYFRNVNLSLEDKKELLC